MSRAPGFYWLTSREYRTGPNPFVAYWSGGDWSFIGSPYLAQDDELDDEGERVMARYMVGDRVEEVVEARTSLNRQEAVIGKLEYSPGAVEWVEAMALNSEATPPCTDEAEGHRFIETTQISDLPTHLRELWTPR